MHDYIFQFECSMFENIEPKTSAVSFAIKQLVDQAAEKDAVKAFLKEQSVFFRANYEIGLSFLKKQKETEKGEILILYCPSTSSMYEAAAAVMLAGAVEQTLEKANFHNIEQGDRFKDKHNTIWTVTYINGNCYHLTSIATKKCPSCAKEVTADRLLDTAYYTKTTKPTNKGQVNSTDLEWQKLVEARHGTFNLEPSKAQNLVIGPIGNAANCYRKASYPLSWVDGSEATPNKPNEALRHFGNGDDAYDYAKQNRLLKDLSWAIGFGPRVKQHYQKLDAIVNYGWIDKAIIITDKWLDVNSSKLKTNHWRWTPLLTSMLLNGELPLLKTEPMLAPDLDVAYEKLKTAVQEVKADPYMAIKSIDMVDNWVRVLTNIEVDSKLEVKNLENRESVITQQTEQLYANIKNNVTELGLDYDKYHPLRDAISQFQAAWLQNSVKQLWLDKQYHGPRNQRPNLLIADDYKDLLETIQADNLVYIITRNLTKLYDKLIVTNIYLGSPFRVGKFLQPLLASGSKAILPVYTWEETEILDAIEKIKRLEERWYQFYASKEGQAILALEIEFPETLIQLEADHARENLAFEAPTELAWSSLDRYFESEDYESDFDTPKVKVLFEDGKLHDFEAKSGVLLIRNEGNEFVAAASLKASDRIIYYNRADKILNLLPDSIYPEVLKDVRQAKRLWREYLMAIYNVFNGDLDRLTSHFKKVEPSFPQQKTVEGWLRSEDTWFPAEKNLMAICAVYKTLTRIEPDANLLRVAEKSYNSLSIQAGRRLSKEIYQWKDKGYKGILLSLVPEDVISRLSSEGTVKKVDIKTT